VWKDVDGVLSCDPRIVPDAKPVTELTYDEATELAFFGAQVRACVCVCACFWGDRGPSCMHDHSSLAVCSSTHDNARQRTTTHPACDAPHSRFATRRIIARAPQVLHPLAMQPAIRSPQDMHVRVKNSYNRTAPGTCISKDRDMRCALVTSLVLKNNVTLVDLVSSRMLGQYGACATCDV
jgi:aspartokinase